MQTFFRISGDGSRALFDVWEGSRRNKFITNNIIYHIIIKFII